MKIQEEIAVLKSNYNDLLRACEEAFDKDISYKHSDDFAFMCVAFCSKQIEHARSLVSLLNNNCNADTMVISRTMIEGMALLIWSGQNKTERAKRWRHFIAVEDYRLAIKKEQSGEVVGQEVKNGILHMLDDHGHLFLKKGCTPVYDFKSDPFKSSWLLDDDLKKIFTEQLFEDAGVGFLYEIFESSSDWIHWGPKGFGVFLKRESQFVTYDFDDEHVVAQSLATAFFSLLYPFKEADSILKFGIGARLEEINNKYLNEVSKVRLRV